MPIEALSAAESPIRRKIMSVRRSFALFVPMTVVLFAGGTALTGVDAARAADIDEGESEALYVSQVLVATEGDLAPDAEIVREGRPISISEAVALAIRNNLDVEVAS